MDEDKTLTPVQFYEERVRPLMTQLVDACKAAGLPVAIGIQIDANAVMSYGWTPAWSDPGLQVAGVVMREQRTASILSPIVLGRPNAEPADEDEGGTTH